MTGTNPIMPRDNGYVSPWQRVIHGATDDYRLGVYRSLCKIKTAEAAETYWMCGRGDQMQRADGSAAHRVVPRGCGHRACPRCSRGRGYRQVVRVEEILSGGDHGDLYHIVLTQRVRPGEPLAVCQRRFNQRANVFFTRLRKTGDFSGGFGAVHLVYSRRGGWHYHMHLLAEVTSGVQIDDLTSIWPAYNSSGDFLDSQVELPFARLLLHAGPAIQKTEAAQGDFWESCEGQVQRGLSYFMRELVKGMGTGTKFDQGESALDDFVGCLGRLRLFRLYGRFRGHTVASDKSEEDLDEKEKEKKKANEPTWIQMGTVDEVTRMASQGIYNACIAIDCLEKMATGNGQRAVRLVAMCRECLPRDWIRRLSSAAA